MTTESHTRRSILTRPAVLSLTLTALVFAIDLALPLGVAAAVPYTFAVLLALKTPVRWFAPAVAVLCCALTVAKVGIVPERGTTEMWKVIVNRCLALFAIGMTTFLGLRRRQAEADRAAAEARTREHLADLARMGRLTTAGQLATGLAHELNQPLAAVCLQAELAEHQAAAGSPPNELLPTLREITEQGQRAADIVRGLRRMLRREEPAPAAIDLGAVVQAVARLIEAQGRRANVDIRLDLAPVPVVNGDRVQIEQVVHNLLLNAIEAAASSPAGPRVVTVSAAAIAGYVVIAVRDTGPGFAPADEPRLFERFFTTKPEGMGMGLAISRSIVEAHGGSIRAGRAPDGGAEFTFSIPAKKG